MNACHCSHGASVEDGTGAGREFAIDENAVAFPFEERPSAEACLEATGGYSTEETAVVVLSEGCPWTAIPVARMYIEQIGSMMAREIDFSFIFTWIVWNRNVLYTVLGSVASAAAWEKWSTGMEICFSTSWPSVLMFH